jgi:hypothetical protein
MSGRVGWPKPFPASTEAGHYPSELVWGCAGVLLKKSCEIAVGTEPELVRNSSDVLLLLT